MEDRDWIQWKAYLTNSKIFPQYLQPNLWRGFIYKGYIYILLNVNIKMNIELPFRPYEWTWISETITNMTHARWNLI